MKKGKLMEDMKDCLEEFEYKLMQRDGHIDKLQKTIEKLEEKIIGLEAVIDFLTNRYL